MFDTARHIWTLTPAHRTLWMMTVKVAPKEVQRHVNLEPTTNELTLYIITAAFHATIAPPRLPHPPLKCIMHIGRLFMLLFCLCLFLISCLPSKRRKQLQCSGCWKRFRLLWTWFPDGGLFNLGMSKVKELLKLVLCVCFDLPFDAQITTFCSRRAGLQGRPDIFVFELNAVKMETKML